MKVMIFAAGMGTRLKPITDRMPKALVPVDGKPLLGILLDKLEAAGVTDVVVNVHHFAAQIVTYLAARPSGTMTIRISDESDCLLDTGGGLRKAAPLLLDGSDEPVIIHNVDILSNVRLSPLVGACRGHDAVLLVSARETQRYLLFDKEMRMVGWTNIATGEVRSPYPELDVSACQRLAFSGIHCVASGVFREMTSWPDKFGIMDFYIRSCARLDIRGYVEPGLRLLDVGKPDALAKASAFVEPS